MNFDLALTRRARCVDPAAVPCRAMMHKRAVVVAGVALALGVTACGSSGSSKGSSASSNPKAPETKNPPGDIPDTQAYVRYTVPASGFSVKVPEGWSQQRSGGAVVFTDKLNTIRLESRPASAARQPRGRDCPRCSSSRPVRASPGRPASDPCLRSVTRHSVPASRHFPRARCR